MIRILDVLISFISLVLLVPFFLVITICIRLTSSGPVFFRQQRVGKNNKDFTLFKFRSMHIGANRHGLLTTNESEGRITSTGRFLRKFKIDELPQLYNVLRGDMSMVGPRPEVRQFVDLYNEEQRLVLLVRPGITDYASIAYKDEDRLLSSQADPEQYYIDYILPEKIKINNIFLKAPTVKNYFKVIFQTIERILH